MYIPSPEECFSPPNTTPLPLFILMDAEGDNKWQMSDPITIKLILNKSKPKMILFIRSDMWNDLSRLDLYTVNRRFLPPLK